LVKRERPGDKSCEERASRPEIEALVLRQFVSKANHEKYNCPNCDLKNYPSQLPPGGSDSNLSIGSNENSFPTDNSERRTPDQQSKEKLSELEKMFAVKIKKIRTSRQKPVLRQARYLQKSPTRIYTKLRKKAFVELMPGQKLPVFEE
ncbi:14841_t:CDS:2, partial [Cetraspora pellucida]